MLYMTKKKRLTIGFTFLGLLILVGICAGCGVAQSMFYYPTTIDYGDSPENQGLLYEDITFPSQDGTLLHGWFVPAVGLPDGTHAKGTVILVHGNAANITNHWAFAQWLPAKGYNVFIFDYRGYGQSQGKPNPKGLFEDTQSAINYIRSRADISPKEIFIIGQSLGGNNAIAAVGAGDKQNICAMVIDSTFYSYSSIANDKLPGAGLLMDNQYSANRFVDKIAPIPLLFIHGKQDQIVPYEQGQRLFEAAHEPKQLITIENGLHISAFSGSHGHQYEDMVDAFFMQALANCAQLAPK